jgi:anti-sigma regulatory factor (Ser/Thr protein kinase)
MTSAGLLAATMSAIALIHRSMPAAHPPVALLILPVVATGMLFGRTLGLAILLSALIGERILFHPGHTGFGFGSSDDLLSFCSIASAMIGSSIVALHAHNATRAVATTEARCHSFNRDVLLAVTSGRLVLCDSREIDAIASGESISEYTIAAASDLPEVRHALKAAAGPYLTEERLGDLLTCITEAATNALKYAGAAAVKTWVDSERVTAIVSDHGHGIDPSLLARATLESGFSTQNTLGMGFTLMLAMADKIALHTTEHGTKVLIQINRIAPAHPGL